MYLATGFASPAGVKSPTRNILLCDIRGNQMVGTNSVERAVLITASGRIRVSATSTDVNAAAAAAGACPQEAAVDLSTQPRRMPQRLGRPRGFPIVALLVGLVGLAVLTGGGANLLG